MSFIRWVLKLRVLEIEMQDENSYCERSKFILNVGGEEKQNQLCISLVWDEGLASIECCALQSTIHLKDCH